MLQLKHFLSKIKERAQCPLHSYASKSPMGDIDFGGHGQLNHIVNEDTGEMFFASGHQFVDGKYLKYDPSINWGHNVKKGQFYFLNTVEKISADDLSPDLYKVLPDMSGGEFFHVVLEMATGDKNKELRRTKHHYYFSSEKQLAGFFSNGPLTMAATGEKGKWDTILPGMEDLFDIVELKNGKIIHKAQEMGLSPSEVIKDVYGMTSASAASERAYNSIISGDKAYRK